MGRRWQREGEEERCIWGRERERASEKGKKEINKIGDSCERTPIYTGQVLTRLPGMVSLPGDILFRS